MLIGKRTVRVFENDAELVLHHSWRRDEAIFSVLGANVSFIHVADVWCLIRESIDAGYIPFVDVEEMHKRLLENAIATPDGRLSFKEDE